ncbi:DnaJ domain-containing protein [Denitratimonas sp. CY0512]|uniref:DnaJ domain-containing protein n=1 Tax=Denitratimonas sp. CY0512 TaxID=3131940 RepID=UPI003098EAD3
MVQMAAASQPLLHKTAQKLGMGEAELLEAVRFYLQQVLFEGSKDAYRTLAVPPDADIEEIRERYRWLQRWLHPDRRGADWESLFTTRLNQAWSQLRTPAARAAYDEERERSHERMLDASSEHPSGVAITPGEWRMVPVPRRASPRRHLKGMMLGLGLLVCAGLLYLAMEHEVDGVPGGSMALELSEAGNDLPVDNKGADSVAEPTETTQVSSVTSSLQQVAGMRTDDASNPSAITIEPAMDDGGSEPAIAEVVAATGAVSELTIASAVVPDVQTPELSTELAPDLDHASQRLTTAALPARKAVQAGDAGQRATARTEGTTARPGTLSRPRQGREPVADPVVRRRAEHAVSDSDMAAPIAKRVVSVQASTTSAKPASSRGLHVAQQMVEPVVSPREVEPVPVEIAGIAAVVDPAKPGGEEVLEQGQDIDPVALGASVDSSLQTMGIEPAAATPGLAVASSHHPEAVPMQSGNLITRIDDARGQVRALEEYFRSVDADYPDWQDADAPHNAQHMREQLRERLGLAAATSFALDSPYWQMSDASVAVQAAYEAGRGQVTRERGLLRADMVWVGSGWQFTRVELEPLR